MTPVARRRATVLAIALVCSLLYLRGASLWLDEASLGLNLRERGLGALWGSSLSYGQVAPRAWLSAIWLLSHGLAAEHPLVLRLVPCLAMIGGVAVWARIARRTLAALPAEAFVCVLLASPAVLQYTAEFKQYSWDVLCVGVGLLCLDRGLAERWRAALFVLAVATSHLAWLPCAALWLARLDRRPRDGALLVGGVAVLFATDVWPQLQHASRMNDYWSAWMIPAWPPAETLRAFVSGQGAQLLGYSAGLGAVVPDGALDAVRGVIFVGMAAATVAGLRATPPTHQVWLRAWLLTVAGTTALALLGLLPLGRRVTLGLFPLMAFGPLLLLDAAAARWAALVRPVALLALAWLLACLAVVAPRPIREDVHPLLPALEALDWLVVDGCSRKQWAMLARPVPPDLEITIADRGTLPALGDDAGGWLVTHRSGGCLDEQDATRRRFEAQGRTLSVLYDARDATLWRVD